MELYSYGCYQFSLYELYPHEVLQNINYFVSQTKESHSVWNGRTMSKLLI